MLAFAPRGAPALVALTVSLLVLAGPACKNGDGENVQLAVCGSAALESGEGCDDGNTTSGDGCSATCTIEVGWDCTTPAGGRTTCVKLAVCGSASLESGEGCDDGNTASGDGCSATCTIEVGWDSPRLPAAGRRCVSLCTPPAPPAVTPGSSQKVCQLAGRLRPRPGNPYAQPHLVALPAIRDRPRGVVRARRPGSGSSSVTQFPSRAIPRAEIPSRRPRRARTRSSAFRSRSRRRPAVPINRRGTGHRPRLLQRPAARRVQRRDDVRLVLDRLHDEIGSGAQRRRRRQLWPRPCAERLRLRRGLRSRGPPDGLRQPILPPRQRLRHDGPRGERWLPARDGRPAPPLREWSVPEERRLPGGDLSRLDRGTLHASLLRRDGRRLLRPVLVGERGGCRPHLPDLRRERAGLLCGRAFRALERSPGPLGRDVRLREPPRRPGRPVPVGSLERVRRRGRSGRRPRLLRLPFRAESGCDFLSDPGRLTTYGGIYRPCPIPRFTSATPAGAAMYFTLSTWNPYNSILMRTEFLRAP